MTEKIKNDIKKGFNLVEILLAMTLIGVMAVGFLPILTKRAKAQKSLDPDCLNGFKMEQKVFNYEEYQSGEAHQTVDFGSGDVEVPKAQIFEVPDDIASPITFILIGGGGNGDGAISQDCTVVTATDTCSLTHLDNTKFYYNVIYNAVKGGTSATCGSGTAGASGEYIYNEKLAISKTNNVFSHSIDDNSNSPFTWHNGVEGEKNSSATSKKLNGGVPPVNIRIGGERAGVGGSCKINTSTYDGYVVDSLNTNGACQITCKIGTPGAGGASGAFKKFEMLSNRGDEYTIRVGRGGETDLNLRATSIVVPGSSDALACRTGNDNNCPQDADSDNETPGHSAETTTIAGGTGGSVIIGGKTISQGALGGCDGATSSVNCSDPNGQNGSMGSGGGGASCNEQGCGHGGKGGDGVVIVQYKVQCK